jgi:hypothetical protein
VPRHHLFDTLNGAEIIEKWRNDYNTNRPHSSLNGLTPTSSTAPMRAKLEQTLLYERGQIGGQVTTHTPGEKIKQDFGFFPQRS